LGPPAQVRIVEEAQREVLALLRQTCGRLDAPAGALLEHETLDETDAYAAAGAGPRTGVRHRLPLHLLPRLAAHRRRRSGALQPSLMSADVDANRRAAEQQARAAAARWVFTRVAA
jgi:hypothetical protein